MIIVLTEIINFIFYSDNNLIVGNTAHKDNNGHIDSNDN